MVSFTALTEERVALLDILAQEGSLPMSQMLSILKLNESTHSAEYQRVWRHLKALQAEGLVLYDGEHYALDKSVIRRYAERVQAWL
jgi:DNA-binding IclR family transcriptional regulator